MITGSKEINCLALALAILAPGTPAIARQMKVLRYPSQVETRAVSRKAAMAFKVPKALRFEVSAVKTRAGKIEMQGYLINPSRRALEVIVFPVHSAYPFFLEFAPTAGLGRAPSKGPPRPPVPPRPVAFSVPAGAKIVFSHAIDLRDYRYKGRPKSVLRWKLYFWNEPKPSGSLRITLPRQPSVGATGLSGGKPSYPAKWLTRARINNRFRCGRLVYKRGCSLLRRGKMTFRITLRASGKVARLERKSTTIRVDPKLVERCILKEVGAWKFTPPAPNMARSFDMVFVLADKC